MISAYAREAPVKDDVLLSRKVEVTYSDEQEKRKYNKGRSLSSTECIGIAVTDDQKKHDTHIQDTSVWLRQDVPT